MSEPRQTREAPTEHQPPTHRELVVVAAACAIAGAAVLFAAGRRWVSYDVVGGGHANAGASGHDVASGASPLGLVMLAGVVALPATRGWLRRVVGIVLAATGAGTVALASYVLADPAAAAGSRHIGVVSLLPNPTVSAQATGWPWVDACAGLVALVAGGMAVLRSGRWAAMGRRYESGGRPAKASSDATSMWDRLDHGDDPTL